MGNCKIAQQDRGSNSLIKARPRTPNEIIAALNNGISLETMLWNERRSHRASRIAWFLTKRSFPYDEAFAGPTKMQEIFNASEQEIKAALKIVLHQWRLFLQDVKQRHKFTRIYKPKMATGKKETSEEFKIRVRRTIHRQVAVAWIIRDITEFTRKGKLFPVEQSAPHTMKEFMADLDIRHAGQISRCVTQLVDWGYTLWFGGSNTKKKSFFLSPDLEERIEDLAQRYGEHRDVQSSHRKRYPYVRPDGITTSNTQDQEVDQE